MEKCMNQVWHTSFIPSQILEKMVWWPLKKEVLITGSQNEIAQNDLAKTCLRGIELLHYNSGMSGGSVLPEDSTIRWALGEDQVITAHLQRGLQPCPVQYFHQQFGWSPRE